MERRAGIDPLLVPAAAARALGLAACDLTVEPTEAGVAGAVYRITDGAIVRFLRLADDGEDNLEVDAVVHERLRELGVCVPHVDHVIRHDDDLGRSILITRHIGRPARRIDAARGAHHRSARLVMNRGGPWKLSGTATRRSLAKT